MGETHFDEGLNEAGLFSIISLILNGLLFHLLSFLMLVPMIMIMVAYDNIEAWPMVIMYGEATKTFLSRNMRQACCKLLS